MKKLLFILAFLISSLNALEINDTKEFYAKQQPTHLQTSFSIEILYKDINKVQNILANTHKKIISTNNLCTGGAYNIQPSYRYRENIREFVGYEGRVDYICNFKEIKNFNKVLNSFSKGKLKLTLNPIEWKIDKKIKDAQTDLLKLKALSYANSFAKKLGKTCKLEKIDFSNMDFDQPQMYALAEAKMSMNSFKPTKEDISIKLFTSFKYLCK